MKGVALIMVFAALTGCATMTRSTTGTIADSWIGAPLSEIVEAWGVPDREFSASEKTIYQWYAPGGALGVAGQRNNTALVTTQEMSCTHQMTVGPSGIVESGNMSGNNCCIMAVSGYCASLKRQGKALGSSPKP